jgi:hypothetical protein
MKLPAASDRKGVQNWYTRPTCGLCGEVSTTSQFLSSDVWQVALLSATCGRLHVRPPSVDVRTTTAEGEFGQGAVSNTSTDR